MLANLPSRTRNIILGVIAAAIVLIGSWWFFLRPALAADTALAASGNIEARTVRVSPEVNGRVLEVLVDEGQAVTAGQPLIKLDDAALQTQYSQAKSALALAQANLALLKAGPSPEQRALQVAQSQEAVLAADQALQDLKDTAALATAQAESDLAHARDQLDKAQQRYKNVNHPDIEWYQEQLDKAKDNLLTLQQNAEIIDIGTLQASLQAAQDAEKAMADRLGKIQAAINGCSDCDPERSVTVDRIPQTLADAIDAHNDTVNRVKELELKIDQAKRGNSTSTKDAQDALDDAQRNLDWALKGPDSIDEALAQADVDSAQAKLDDAQRRYDKLKDGPDPEKLAAAEARLASAKAALAAAQAGPSAEQIAVSEAQVASAQAQVDNIEVQLKRFIVVSPIDAVVLARSIEPGENTAPGATLFELGQLKTLELTVYLPEENFALVTPGEKATVSVDAYPNRTFTATVLQLADQAEFTPRNVQTVEGRKDTVYAVKLGIDNPDLALKPGMPADVSFGQ